MKLGKRLGIGFLVVLLLLVNIPGVNPRGVAATAHTPDEAIAYLDQLVGTKVGSGQCVALIKAYYSYLGVSPVTGNACEYATNALPSGWTRIKGATPQKGDILVWVDGLEGYGHVAICGGSNVYYHQNWSGQYVQILNKSYTGGFSISGGAYYATYWGVIRPDFTTVPYSYTTITSGNYFLKNKAYGKYLCVSYGVDADEQNVDIYDFVDSAALQWNLSAPSSAAEYELTPLCSWTRLLNVYADAVSAGKNVNIYKRVNDGTQRWKFEKVSGGFILHNAQNPACVLDVQDGYNAYVSTYSAANSQIWELQSRIYYDANGGTGAPGAAWKTYGTALSLSNTKPTKSGYTFLGWSTDKNATTASYAAGASYTAEGTRTLYAVYKKTKTHTICTFGNWTTVKEATCTVTGTEQRVCSVCKKTETRTTTALGHRLGNWTVVKKATCTEAGQQKQACSRSGCTYAVTKAILATGHQFAAPVVTKKPTCTESGIESGKCTQCEAQTTKVIAATGHDFENPVVVTPAGLGTPEVLSGKCKNCQETTREERDCRYHDTQSDITISSEKGVFAANTKAEISLIGSESLVYENVREKMEDNSSIQKLYEISYSLNGKKVSPSGAYTLSLPLATVSENLRIFHVGADGTIAEMSFAVVENYATVETNESGYFVVSVENKTTASDIVNTTTTKVSETTDSSDRNDSDETEFPWTFILIVAGFLLLSCLVVAGLFLIIKRVRNM